MERAARVWILLFVTSGFIAVTDRGTLWGEQRDQTIEWDAAPATPWPRRGPGLTAQQRAGALLPLAAQHFLKEALPWERPFTDFIHDHADAIDGLGYRMPQLSGVVAHCHLEHVKAFSVLDDRDRPYQWGLTDSFLEDDFRRVCLVNANSTQDVNLPNQRLCMAFSSSGLRSTAMLGSTESIPQCGQIAVRSSSRATHSLISLGA